MNVERFYAAISALKLEFDSDNIAGLLNNVFSTLQQSVSQPNQPQNAEAFKTDLGTLKDALSGASSNFTVPTRRNIYDEIGATEVIGQGLLDRIEEVLSKNHYTPAAAVGELQKTVQDVTTFHQAINTICSSFESLSIGCDDLEEGEIEIGLSLPKELVGEDISSIEKELHQMQVAFKGFKEVAGDDASDMHISSISASEWQFFLDSLPATATLVSVALERIVALYKTNLEIKLLNKQLEERNLPPEATAPLKKYVDDHIKAEMQNISDELVNEFYSGKDEKRKNELRTHLTVSLTYLGERIEHGATIEVRAEPPRQSEDEGDEEAAKPKLSSEQKKILKTANKINEHMQNVIRLQVTEMKPLKLGTDISSEKPD